MRNFLSPTLNRCSGRRLPINTHESVQIHRNDVSLKLRLRGRQRPWLCDHVRSSWIVLWIVLAKRDSSRQASGSVARITDPPQHLHALETTSRASEPVFVANMASESWRHQLDSTSIFSDVVIHHEFVGVRTQAEGVHLFFSFEIDVSVEHFLGENISLHQDRKST